MKRLLILTLLGFLFSCNPNVQSNDSKSNGDSNNQKGTSENQVSSIDIVIEKDKRIFDFQISDCKNECELDSGQVLTNDLVFDTLNVRVAHWMNCSWNQGYLEDINFKNDTLNILLDRPYDDIEYDEDGNEMKIYSMTDCNCIFFIDLKLEDIENKPKTILVNSNPVKNGYWN